MWCESHQYPIPNVSGLIYNNHMNAEIYEIDYSVSPGGINMWALDIRDSLGHSSYAEFRNASQALKWIMNRYPDKELNISVRSIEWFNKQDV